MIQCGFLINVIAIAPGTYYRCSNGLSRVILSRSFLRAGSSRGITSRASPSSVPGSDERQRRQHLWRDDDSGSADIDPGVCTRPRRPSQLVTGRLSEPLAMISCDAECRRVTDLCLIMSCAIVIGVLICEHPQLTTGQAAVACSLTEVKTAQYVVVNAYRTIIFRRFVPEKYFTGMWDEPPPPFCL